MKYIWILRGYYSRDDGDEPLCVYQHAFRTKAEAKKAESISESLMPVTYWVLEKIDL